jgi:nucleolar GTP-binding protein
MQERGGAGVYSCDFREQYLGLRDPEWKLDSIPEIMDGKNIMDFVDPEIERMLEELDREEEEREARGEYEDDMEEDDDLTEVEKAQVSFFFLCTCKVPKKSVFNATGFTRVYVHVSCERALHNFQCNCV